MCNYNTMWYIRCVACVTNNNDFACQAHQSTQKNEVWATLGEKKNYQMLSRSTEIPWSQILNKRNYVNSVWLIY